MRYTNLLYKSHFWLITLAVIILGVLAVISAPLSNRNKQTNQAKALKSSSKTQALQIINAEIVGEQVRIKIKNVSDKNINAYRVRAGDTDVTTEMIYGEPAEQFIA